jgi:hypothetical protein
MLRSDWGNKKRHFADLKIFIIFTKHHKKNGLRISQVIIFNHLQIFWANAIQWSLVRFHINKGLKTHLRCGTFTSWCQPNLEKSCMSAMIGRTFATMDVCISAESCHICSRLGIVKIKKYIIFMFKHQNGSS